MKLLASLRFRIATLFQRSHRNTEMEEELRSHIQHRADDLERSGLARAEAERRARIEFGGYERYRQESYEAAGGQFLRNAPAGCALLSSRVAQVARLHHRRCVNAGIGHRRQCRGVWRVECADSAPAECAAAAEPLCHRARERSGHQCNRIPTISICAIAIAASMVWRLMVWLRWGWIPATTHRRPGSMR